MRSVLHIDMDAFFASVEQRDDRALRDRPVLVGGRGARGVVAAASYEARASGARSAMPMREALRRCPSAIVVPPRPSRYAEVSAEVFAVFREFSPLVEGLSLDEAFVDVTASRSLFGPPASIARAIKDAIRERTSLTASAGVAKCKLVAKIASDLEKPDGLTVAPDDERRFLAPMPIERIPGVGPKLASRLGAWGFRTIGDLAASDEGKLERVAANHGARLRALARAEDPRPVVPHRAPKSVGSESTYERDLTRRADVADALVAHASRVALRLTRAGLSARTVTLRLKHADFTAITRQRAVREPVADTEAILAVACSLLDECYVEPAPLRLVGVAASDLTSDAPKLTLFPDARREKLRRLEGVALAVGSRFGDARLRRAVELPSRGDGDEVE